MPNPTNHSPQLNLRMIWIPAWISLGVTLLRLTGELRHWSTRWFSPETGGITPHGLSWIIGITWLAVPFGVYFALKLARTGVGPQSIGRAALFVFLGIVVMLGYPFLYPLIPLRFPNILIYIWLCWSAAAVLQYFGWPSLFKTLLAYGLAARIPVAIVMFFAMRGNWGTHYDYVGMPPQFNMSPVPRFLWLAFFPQLVAWVAFTISIGTIAGVIATAIVRPTAAATDPDRSPSPRV
jgi:hypothetical protein